MSVSVNPNDVDRATVTGSVSTADVNVYEYSRFRSQILNRYNKFRFVGGSATITRVGDRSLLSASNTQPETGSVLPNSSVAMLDAKYDSKCRGINDSYQPLAVVTANPMGMEEANNVRHLFAKKPVKIAKFVVPNNKKRNQWVNVNATSLPVSTSVLPAPFQGKTIEGFMNDFYPNSTEGATGSYTNNIPKDYLLQFDTFAQIPTTATAGSVFRPVTEFSYTINCNFYFECCGRDTDGAV